MGPAVGYYLVSSHLTALAGFRFPEPCLRASVCDRALCHYPSVGSNFESHRKEFHSVEHRFSYNGQKVKVSRRADGKLPCPCGSETHARYSFKKLTSLTRLLRHPFAHESPHPDHRLDGLISAKDPFSSTPVDSSMSITSQPLDCTSHSPASRSRYTPASTSTIPQDEDFPSAMDIEAVKEVPRETTVCQTGRANEDGEGQSSNRCAVENGSGANRREAQSKEQGFEGTPAIPSLLRILMTLAEDGLLSDDDPGFQDEYPQERDEGDEDLMDLGPEVGSTPPNAARVSLARFNITVEPVYNLTICTECNKPTKYEHVHAHQWQKHYKGLNLPPELRLPRKLEILTYLVILGADNPRPVPSKPIAPIEGIEIANGYKCTLSGCHDAIFGSSRSLRRHQLESHPEVPVGDRISVRIPCQPLSVFRKDLRYVELIPEVRFTSSVLRSIVEAAENCHLLQHSDIFTVASNEREKNGVFAQSRWDELLQGVNITSLTRSISTHERETYTSFKRLCTVAREYYEEVSKRLPKLPVLVRRYIASSNPNDLKHKPFRRPQELKTVIQDADRTAQFLAFLITTNDTPIDSFPVPLHPSLKSQLEYLASELKNEFATNSTLKDLFHQTIWLALSLPSDEYIRNELMCPFTRFLIAVNLKDSGAFVRASVIPPIIAQPQWCFRATAAEHTLRIQEEYNGDSMLAYTSRVQRFIIDAHSVLFTTLRQNMNLFKAIASRQQGVARFNWNIERSVISIDGFPIAVSSFVDGVHRTLTDVEASIERLFRGCPYLDILQHIDDAMVPHNTGQPRWFRDRPGKSDVRYSFFEEAENGFQQFRPRLLDHLSQDPKFFTTVGERTIAKNGAILGWFSELDEIVRKLYYLISTTWGGGSRGTEIERLLYSNSPRNTRNVFVINGLLTILTEYQKTQSLTGAGKLIARSPAFRVNRLLILILGVAYWAAGYIGCRIGMDKGNCQRYFYEVFVLTGKPMESKDFSKVLGSNIMGAGLP
ncbi:hypothetical protein C8J55DRAFT_561224 [Lentinula edodes]|uniref:Uncharacterized protein n=1 Tax=Lentinula lateritia TaxID=40482 RepID=A0A9W9DPM8_9AGAR|nr:hypothetical protein C8J55DRAFT_561223 [Lentinula edodes]KAJ4478862.1 hypothetical protein C8J55DRAFT_561224 [Lentinula edodes]